MKKETKKEQNKERIVMSQSEWKNDLINGCQDGWQ